MKFLIRGEDFLKRQPDFKLIGREAKLLELASVLLRNRANSVLLVGPNGVGLTALCMGLQACKTDAHVPFDIVSTRIFWLDTDSLFASGDTEQINQSFQKMIGLLNQTPESVLVIEDTKDFIEACKNNGTMHFINALLLAIRNKQTQIILETRDEDIEDVLRCHSDIREVFTVIDLNEPTGEALNKIVENNAHMLSNYHKIRIAPDAIGTAIELTNTYRNVQGLNAAQPTRSTTILDRAFATYRINAHKTTVNDINQKQLKKLFELQREGEIALLNNEEEIEQEIAKDENNNQPKRLFGSESETVRQLKSTGDILRAEISKNKQQFDELAAEINKSLLLTADLVKTEFSSISGIALDKLNEDAREKLRNLESELAKHIYGQNHVLTQVANAVKTAKIGRRNKDKPLAAFMMLGPSGVGKTELAKKLAQCLLDDEKALTRFDMSEFMEKHAVAKLIGCPPGYEGYDPKGGILTKCMRANPKQILLFDEIEKAQPEIFNIFLQILSDGRLTDPIGRTVSFSDAIIVMTTNIGQQHFIDNPNNFETAKEGAIIELNKTYRSEFLNRFAGRQNIICFNLLGLDTMEKIVKREIASIQATYANDGISIVVAETAIRDFCKDHYDPAIGARGLPGYIQTYLEPTIVNMILDGKKGTVNIGYDGKVFNVEIV